MRDPAIQGAPKIVVGDGLSTAVLPARTLPLGQPFGRTLDQVLRVRANDEYFEGVAERITLPVHRGVANHDSPMESSNAGIEVSGLSCVPLVLHERCDVVSVIAAIEDAEGGAATTAGAGVDGDTGDGDHEPTHVVGVDLVAGTLCATPWAGDIHPFSSLGLDVGGGEPVRVELGIENTAWRELFIAWLVGLDTVVSQDWHGHILIICRNQGIRGRSIA